MRTRSDQRKVKGSEEQDRISRIILDRRSGNIQRNEIGLDRRDGIRSGGTDGRIEIRLDKKDGIKSNNGIGLEERERVEGTGSDKKDRMSGTGSDWKNQTEQIRKIVTERSAAAAALLLLLLLLLCVFGTSWCQTI